MPELPEAVLNRARRVFPMAEASGVIVWEREDALELLPILRAHQLGVFGGDAYVEVLGRLTPEYAPWSFDEKIPFETWLDLSVESARSFILAYPRKANVWFELSIGGRDAWDRVAKELQQFQTLREGSGDA